MKFSQEGVEMLRNDVYRKAIDPIDKVGHVMTDTEIERAKRMIGWLDHPALELYKVEGGLHQIAPAPRYWATVADALVKHFDCVGEAITHYAMCSPIGTYQTDYYYVVADEATKQRIHDTFWFCLDKMKSLGIEDEKRAQDFVSGLLANPNEHSW